MAISHIAHLQSVLIREGDGGEIAGYDLEKDNLCRRVAADELRLDLTPVLGSDDDDRNRGLSSATNDEFSVIAVRQLKRGILSLLKVRLTVSSVRPRRSPMFARFMGSSN